MDLLKRLQEEVFQAPSEGDPRVVAMNKGNELVRQSAVGNVGGVEKLLGDGADVNFKDNYGKTALHKAAKAGKVGVVKALLRAGANPKAKDNAGQTALRLATIKIYRDDKLSANKEEIARILTDLGVEQGIQKSLGDLAREI